MKSKNVKTTENRNKDQPVLRTLEAKNPVGNWLILHQQYGFTSTKETTLERADFTLQLLMFVTAEKERRMFTIYFLSIFCQLLSPRC